MTKVKPILFSIGDKFNDYLEIKYYDGFVNFKKK